MKKNLTARYLLHQMTYWAASAGIVSFAATFLLDKGLAAALVGTLLALGNLLSCGLQPVLADFADRSGGNVLKWMTVALTALCVLCFATVKMLPSHNLFFGIVYLLGIFCFDAMMPLMNAINVYYTEHGFQINYGLGRGLGSFAYAMSALVVGRVMASFGADWMLWISMSLLCLNAVLAAGYPGVGRTLSAKQREDADCCTIFRFFGRYRWFCLSLAGVMLLGMFHAMTENYMIQVVTPLGGDSGTVGVALFIATFAETFVIVFFESIRKRIPDTWLLKIAGLSFLLKSVLLLLAGNVTAIYFIALLQATSYSFLSPTQMYYASAKIRAVDMVKGQAFITASDTLGCALGNFSGGQILQWFDVRAMLMAGIGMAAAGTLVLFATVNKTDM